MKGLEEKYLIITKDYTPLGSVEINLKDENLNFYAFDDDHEDCCE